MLQKGDRLILETGGGAGYGRPARRSPEAVEGDVAEGWVSRRQARANYSPGGPAGPPEKKKGRGKRKNKVGAAGTK